MSELKDELVADVTDEHGLTNKDNKFLEVLFDECKGNIKEAMKVVGLTGPQSAITKRLGKQIKELSSDYLLANTARATISLVTTLDDPNLPGTKNILATAKEILDRSGVVKKEETQVVEHNYMFILPAKDSPQE